MSIPDHEIEVGPWPDYGLYEEDSVRTCSTCIHYGPEASIHLDLKAVRHPCQFPIPEYMQHFFKIAHNMLPTDGGECAVHQLESEAVSRSLGTR
jgi:hypothetical protein